MTFDEFLDMLTGDNPNERWETVTSIGLGPDDIEAARIMKELGETMGDQTLEKVEAHILNKMLEAKYATLQDVEGPLDSEWQDSEVRAYLHAWWWLIFWAEYLPGNRQKRRK